MRHDVPQGGVMSPIIFLLFNSINDMVTELPRWFNVCVLTQMNWRYSAMKNMTAQLHTGCTYKPAKRMRWRLVCCHHIWHFLHYMINHFDKAASWTQQPRWKSSQVWWWCYLHRSDIEQTSDTEAHVEGKARKKLAIMGNLARTRWGTHIGKIIQGNS